MSYILLLFLIVIFITEVKILHVKNHIIIDSLFYYTRIKFCDQVVKGDMSERSEVNEMKEFFGLDQLW